MSKISKGPGENAAAKDGGRPDVTGPETATGTYKTKLSASGLVYKHYGRDILKVLHPSLADAPTCLQPGAKLYCPQRGAPLPPEVNVDPSRRRCRSAWKILDSSTPPRAHNIEMTES